MVFDLLHGGLLVLLDAGKEDRWVVFKSNLSEP